MLSATPQLGDRHPGQLLDAGAGAAPAPALTLPRLADAPAKLTLRSGAPVAARIALALLDLGLVDESRLKAQSSPEQVIAHAFDRWLVNQSAGIEICPLQFHITDENATNGFNVIWSSENQEEPEHWFALSARSNLLERAHPGLGQTALNYLYTAWGRSVSLAFTPSCAEDFACHYFWRGEMDERGVLDEIADEGGKLEDYEIMTRAQFDKIIPKWAQRPRRVLSLKRLQGIARRKPRTLSGMVAAVCIEIANASNRRNLGRICERPDWLEDDLYGFSVVARWTPNDCCTQLIDYHIEMLASNGQSEAILGVDAIEATPKAIATWFKFAERTIALQKLAEKLTFLVGDQYA